MDYLTKDGHITQDPNLAADPPRMGTPAPISEYNLPQGSHPQPAQASPFPYDLGGINPSTGADAPFSVETQMSPVAPMSPEEQQAAERMRLADLGLEYHGGSAAREAGWRPHQRTGALADINEPERQNLAARARGIARDERDITYEENDLQKVFARNQEVKAYEQVIRKENRVAEIDSEVSRQRGELDDAISRQKTLLNKGISPWEAFGSGSKAQGQISAALTLGAGAFAGPESAQQTQNLVNGIIDREVANQKYMLEQSGDYANNMYARLMDRYDDRDQAEAALRILMGEATKAELQSMTLQSADPRAKLAADKTIQSIDEGLLAENELFRARAQGNLTERYDAGSAGSRAGMRRMRQDKWDAHLGKRATTAGKETGTMAAQQGMAFDAERARQEAAAGGPEPDFKGKATPRKQYAAAGALKKQLNDIARLRGEEGYDAQGRPQGRSEKFWADKVPGRGFLDRTTSKLPGVNPSGRQYSDRNEQIKQQVALLLSGTTMTEGQMKRISDSIDATDEEGHLSGMDALYNTIDTIQKGAADQLNDQEKQFLDRNTRNANGAPTPGQFGDIRK